MEHIVCFRPGFKTTSGLSRHLVMSTRILYYALLTTFLECYQTVEDTTWVAEENNIVIHMRGHSRYSAFDSAISSLPWELGGTSLCARFVIGFISARTAPAEMETFLKWGSHYPNVLKCLIDVQLIAMNTHEYIKKYSNINRLYTTTSIWSFKELITFRTFLSTQVGKESFLFIKDLQFLKQDIPYVISIVGSNSNYCSIMR